MGGRNNRRAPEPSAAGAVARRAEEGEAGAGLCCSAEESEASVARRYGMWRAHWLRSSSASTLRTES